MDGRNIGPVELREAWWLLTQEDRIEGFQLLEADDAEEFFFDLSADDQAELVLSLRPGARRIWLRLLPPDDAADLIQSADEEQREGLLRLLDDNTRREVSALLAYEEDEAGGLMSSRFARAPAGHEGGRGDQLSAQQAIGTHELETIYYVYVLDAQQYLLGSSPSASCSPHPAILHPRGDEHRPGRCARGDGPGSTGPPVRRARPAGRSRGR